MPAATFAGRSILVVGDEPLIALDIAATFECAGARVLRAGSLREGLCAVDHRDLSAAVVDYRLADGDSSALCERLLERGVPFVVYSGYRELHEACRQGVCLSKPADPGFLLATVADLVA